MLQTPNLFQNNLPAMLFTHAKFQALILTATLPKTSPNATHKHENPSRGAHFPRKRVLLRPQSTHGNFF